MFVVACIIDRVMNSGLHISLNAETLFHFGNLPISNSMLTSTIVGLLLLIFALFFRRKFDQKSIHPTGIQNFAEWLIESLFNLINSVTGDSKKSRLFFPALTTFFLFIILNNWFGLIPGVGSIGLNMIEPTKRSEPIEITVVDEAKTEPVLTEEEIVPSTQPKETHKVFAPIFRPGTADLNTTIALAIISVFLIQYFGVKYLKLSYFKKFFNFTNPINGFVGLLETISEFDKVISFAFRLFGNIFAGEVLIAVITYLTRVLVPVPFYGLEVFVGFIQTLVFVMLSLVFYNMATAKSH